MIIVVGDIHWKEKMPYKAALHNLFGWLVENYKDDTLILTGDVFDNSTPHFDEIYNPVIDYLLQFKEVHIVEGNHDRSRRKGSCLTPLMKHKPIHVYQRAMKGVIEGMDFLFLPYPRNQDMRDAYNEITSSHDYIITHIEPKQCAFSLNGIDLKTKGDHFHGHVHMQQWFKTDAEVYHNVIGVPLPTRNGENQPCRIVQINGKADYEFVDVPSFLRHENVVYGEEPENKLNILNIKEAPSVDSVYQRYPASNHYYIREEGIELLRTEGEDTFGSEFQASMTSLKARFSQFVKDRKEDEDQEDISAEIQEKVLAYIDRND